MPLRKMLPFLLTNIVVSAIVLLAILYWWDSRQPELPAVDVNLTAVASITPLAIPPTTGATAAEASTPTPEPADEMPIHIVQAGDTLGNISAFYDVPMDDIMTVNGLTNANILTVGQQLLIPVGGIPTPAPPPTTPPQEVGIPTPIPTQPGEGGTAVVSISTVIEVGEPAAEAVQILNTGTASVAMLGWTLIDESGREYTFGQTTLFGEGGGILLHTRSGQNTATELFWGVDTAVWSPGETVTLRDNNGVVQASYTIPLE